MQKKKKKKKPQQESAGKTKPKDVHSSSHVSSGSLGPWEALAACTNEQVLQSADMELQLPPSLRLWSDHPKKVLPREMCHQGSLLQATEAKPS